MPPLLKQACLGLLALLLGSQAHAQQQDKPRLLGLYQKALLNDKTYLAAQAQYQADQQNPVQAFSALLPKVNFNANLQTEDRQSESAGLRFDTSSSPRTYALSLNQALFRPQVWETYKQSQLNEEIAKLNLQKSVQDLALRLARAYFDTLTAQDELATLGSQKLATQAQLESAQRNFEIGTATVTDQQEAQARFDLITAQEIAASNALTIAQLNLELIVGEPVSALVPLARDAKLTLPEPQELTQWVERATHQNPNAQQARLAELISKREVKKAQFDHLPTLDLTAQYVDAEQQSFDGTAGRPLDLALQTRSVGLVLNVPIFTGGATQSNIEKQAQLLNKTRLDKDNAINIAGLQAKSSYLKVRSGLSQIAALEAAVQSSSLALQANETGYQVGVRINIDVLNAQQQVSSTQRDLFKAKYGTLLNMLELQAAVGQLEQTQIEFVDALLAVD